MTRRTGLRLRLRGWLIGGAAAVALAAMPQPARAQEAFPVAIVVHPSVAIDDLSFADLRRIFMAQQQFWRDNSRITLLVRAPVARERMIVLERIYRMSEDQFRQFWIAKMFRADVASGPKIVYSSEMARELVTAIPGAITFLPFDAVTRGVKVLRIDGKLPNDAGYPLR
ncbi:MAG TPA: hypothetical protein VFZ24_09025 [Longimicrobiales bacterium]